MGQTVPKMLGLVMSQLNKIRDEPARNNTIHGSACSPAVYKQASLNNNRPQVVQIGKVIGL
jgi:hypothetical protein